MVDQSNQFTLDVGPRSSSRYGNTSLPNVTCLLNFPFVLSTGFFRKEGVNATAKRTLPKQMLHQFCGHILMFCQTFQASGSRFMIFFVSDIVTNRHSLYLYLNQDKLM
jgi:hypothetical protein